jgi:hypothetical protein
VPRCHVLTHFQNEEKVEIHLKPMGLASGEKEAVQKMNIDAAMARQ